MRHRIAFLIWLVLLVNGICNAEMTNVAICTIFKDDAPFLKEWIEFHKLQGVEHFYLYNNNSSDDFRSVLNPYVRNGDVTLIDWPYTYGKNEHSAWIRIQTGAYMDCIQKVRNKVKWLAVVDSDEFLFCTSGEKLPTFLTGYEQFPGLAVNWIKFGTSSVYDIPPGYLMIELLTKTLPLKDKNNFYVKTIVQPKYVESCISPHYFLYRDGLSAVDANKRPIMHQRKTVSRRLRIGKIRINHYWSRTEKYFLATKAKRRNHIRNAFTMQKILNHAIDCNSRLDTTILQFVAPLREQMGLAPKIEWTK